MRNSLDLGGIFIADQSIDQHSRGPSPGAGHLFHDRAASPGSGPSLWSGTNDPLYPCLWSGSHRPGTLAQVQCIDPGVCSGGTVWDLPAVGHPGALTFADDEAALIRRHGVRYLLDAAGGSHAPVAPAPASSPGHRKATEAISFLGGKKHSSDNSATVSGTTFRLQGGGEMTGYNQRHT